LYPYFAFFFNFNKRNMIFKFYSSPTDNNRVSVVGEHTNGVLRIAVARCSNKDHFVRKKGRTIAEGRLLKGKLWGSLAVPQSKMDVKTFVSVAKDIAFDVSISKQICKK
jgi:hypothetical protein